MGKQKKKLSYQPKYKVPVGKVLPELGKHILVDGFPMVVDVHRSRPDAIVDALTGNAYLDFFTCFASMPLGFNPPELVQEDFIRYIGELALNKPSNSDLYTEAMATFVKTLFRIAVKKPFHYAFFIEGGALAVENALKTAFDWKVQKNFRKGYRREKGHRIIHFRQAFHGRSGYTLSLTNTDPTKTKYFPKFKWPRIHNPAIRFPLTEENLERLQAEEQRAIAQIKKAFQQYKDDIAAIIIEPIQGEGGDNHFRPEFLQQLRYLADENEALLIFDEVQTGVGITGTWWAYQQLGVTPDILVFGKKMQVCGIVATRRIDDIETNVFHTSSRINSTWGGNLIDMVRATRYLEVIQEQKYVQNARKMGNYLLRQLIKLQEEFGHLISNVRGRGLFCAFDFPTSQQRDQFRQKLFEQQVLMLPCGERSMRFRPPLNVTKTTIDEGIDRIRQVLKTL